jgi:DNA-binding response OmpR family regulator
LVREGMRVVEVEDGYELRDYLELCRPGGDLSAPDVVISDVNMPGESGPDAIGHSPFLLAPVVLISACGSKELRAWAARIKVAAIFEKPFDLDALMVAIRRVIRA